MAVLNLRNVPEDLMRDLRKAAIDAGMGNHLHDYCRQLLARALAREASEATMNDDSLNALRAFKTSMREQFPTLRPVSSDIEIT